MPAAIASSAAYWMRGLSIMGINSLGIALVAGKNRVPKPATGKTALRSFCTIYVQINSVYQFNIDYNYLIRSSMLCYTYYSIQNLMQ